MWHASSRTRGSTLLARIQRGVEKAILDYRIGRQIGRMMMIGSVLHLVFLLLQPAAMFLMLRVQRSLSSGEMQFLSLCAPRHAFCCDSILCRIFGLVWQIESEFCRFSCEIHRDGSRRRGVPAHAVSVYA